MPESMQKQDIKVTRYNYSSLTNRDINNRYTVTVRNEFETFQKIFETHSPNDEYENIITAHLLAAASNRTKSQIFSLMGVTSRKEEMR